MATQAFDYALPRPERFIDHHLAGRAAEVANEIIGSSSWAQNARKLVALHAAHDNTLILEGEPGTGRKFLARLIHRASRFSDGPFVSLDVSANATDGSDAAEAPDQLARAALLGLLNGGEADPRPLGLRGEGTLYVETAAGRESSSLFDALQRADHNRRYGGAGLQFRILIGRATRAETRAWRLASNRLDYETLRVPSLRARTEDIEPLALHFIGQYCRRTGKELRSITPAVTEALRRYDWPRNISELKTTVVRLVGQTKAPSIDASLLPTYLASDGSEESFFPASGVDLAEEVERFEVSLIREALRLSRGRQNAAAGLLRVKPTTLFMKLKRYSIEPDDFKTGARLKASTVDPTDRGLKEAGRPEPAGDQIHW